MNWSRRRSSSSPPGTGGVAEGRGGSKVENEWGGELFDSSTTPSLRATPYSSKQVRKLGEEREPSSRFFLFGSFSFFVDGCGNVEKFLQARRAGLRIPHPDQLAWLTGDIRIRPKPGAKRILRCCPSRTRL